ncbi:transposase [Algoriphagus vanfongensis]|uniref:transposase n=1 Tax=Algoriphagus vanfongensis TaxID=426371 RepID=UPI0003FE39F5|nr:transposase [Algoriphagus vanfongensis]
MSGTFTKQILHITFSTRARENLILQEFEEPLFSYISGICKQQNCVPIAVGGYLNHVHILCHLSKNIALATLMEHIKTHSSKFMKTLSPNLNNFYWQNGYGAFSVNPRDIDKVISYIKNQRKHHQSKTFQEEYLAFLKAYQIEFDEKYLWN